MLYYVFVVPCQFIRLGILVIQPKLIKKTLVFLIVFGIISLCGYGISQKSLVLTVFHNLKNGTSRKKGQCIMAKVNELTGKRFTMLTVIRRGENDKTGKAKWVCKCDCGKEICVTGNALLTGKTKSCGCTRRYNTGLYKHGLSGTKLYNVWCSMKDRCYNHNNKRYSDWGARGILICDEWKNNFIVFRDWALKNGYKEGLTIDRIDNCKGYYPENCRWVSYKEQANNTRRNIFITVCEETHSVSEWAEIKGISQWAIRSRLKRGWSGYDAVTKPIDKRAH